MPGYPDGPATARPEQTPSSEFGCETCRGAFGPEHFGNRAIPDVLVPVHERLGRPLPEWTRPFHACHQCDAVWSLWLEPKEETYRPFTTPLGTTRALLSEGNLDHILTLVFSWFPVQEQAERALWSLRYPAHLLWTRLLEYWGQTREDHAGRGRILTLMAGLLQLRNPYHQAMPINPGNNRRTLLSSLQGFDRELESMYAAWSAHYRDAQAGTASTDSTPRPPGPGDAKIAAFAQRHLETLISIERRLTVLGLWRTPLSNFSGDHTPPPASADSTEAPYVAADPPRDSGIVAGPRGLLARSLELLMPYWRFLPSIAVGWLLTERAAGNTGEAAGLGAMLFFLSIVLVLDGSAVAASARISDAPMRRIVWRRLSVIGDYLLFGLLTGIVMFAYVAAAILLGVDRAGLSATAHTLAMLLLVALLFSRLWPFWVIPFMQPVERDIVTPRAPGITRRPALTTAWALTRRAGAFRRLTLPWLGCVAAGIMITFMAGQVWGDIGRALLLYPVILPGLTAITWAMTEALLDHDITTLWE